MKKSDKDKSAKLERRSMMGFDRQGDSVSADDLTNPESQDDQAPESEVSVESTLRKERDEYYDLLLRKQAEFENYRKRVLREREEVRSNARADLIAELLPVLDSCEKGLQAMQEETVPEPCRAYVDGYALLLRQLQAFLERHEVKEVPGVGSAFDPNVHEAIVSEVTEDRKHNQVVEEFRKGYVIGEKLLRPSQVKVAVPANEVDPKDS
jgi:molecular chaperone GrpE